MFKLKSMDKFIDYMFSSDQTVFELLCNSLICFMTITAAFFLVAIIFFGIYYIVDKIHK